MDAGFCQGKDVNSQQRFDVITTQVQFSDGETLDIVPLEIAEHFCLRSYPGQCGFI